MKARIFDVDLRRFVEVEISEEVKSQGMELSLSEKRRMQEVVEMLKEGKNPYTKVADERLGVGVYNDPQQVVKEKSDEEVERLEQKWKDGVDGRVRPIIYKKGKKGEFPLAPFTQQVIAEVEAPQQGESFSTLDCSFCHKPTSRVMATFGSGPLRKVISDEFRVVDGTLTFEEKVVHIVEKVVACSSCAHLIRPILNSKGEMLGHGMKFESEG